MQRKSPSGWRENPIVDVCGGDEGVDQRVAPNQRVRVQALPEPMRVRPFESAPDHSLRTSTDFQDQISVLWLTGRSRVGEGRGRMSPNRVERAGRPAAGIGDIPRRAVMSLLARLLPPKQPLVSIRSSLRNGEPGVLRLTTALSRPGSREQ